MFTKMHTLRHVYTDDELDLDDDSDLDLPNGSSFTELPDNELNIADQEGLEYDGQDSDIEDDYEANLGFLDLTKSQVAALDTKSEFKEALYTSFRWAGR